MGVNLQRERFADWLEAYGPDSRRHYLAELEKHVGRKIDVGAWQIEDKAFPRVGSYTSYGIFRRCLQFVAQGDYASDLDEGEDVDLEALQAFRDKLKPKSVKVPYAAHFLDTGDTDTIFIPALFDTPFAYDERFVASLPGGVKALEAFAKGLGFKLAARPEAEHSGKNARWLPLATARNVARILHRFFTEKPNACVILS